MNVFPFNGQNNKRRKKGKKQYEERMNHHGVLRQSPYYKNDSVNCVIKAILWYSAFTHKNEHTPDTYIK